MSHRPAPSIGGMLSGGAGSSSLLSTREQILQRYANSGSSGGGAAGRQKSMEMFETGSTADSVENSHVTHSRSLLLSSGGGAGAGSMGGVGVGKKSSLSSGSSSGAAVEDVDSTTRVKPALAFQHFAGALYTGAGDRSSGSFESGPSALLVAGSGTGSTDSSASSSVRLKFENPFVKLRRLQDDLKEFDSELRAAAASVPQPSKAGAGGVAQDAAQDIWTSLAGNVQQLQGQLDQLIEQPQVKQMLQQQGQAADAGAATSSSLLPQFDSLFEQYVAELTANPAFQPFPSADAAAATPSPAAATSSSASAAELAALPKLDERLHVLEKLLGASTASSAAAPPTAALPAPDIVSSLAALHAQLVQLNPQRLEFVARSCKQILIEQEGINLAKKEREGDAQAAATGGAAAAGADGKDSATAETKEQARPYAAQVAHLYALTSRWDSLALTLPPLIARLSSLHALHASSATLAQRVSTLERQSGAIESALTAQRDGVAAVAATAKDNLAAMHANFKAMDERIQQITKKMEQLSK